VLRWLNKKAASAAERKIEIAPPKSWCRFLHELGAYIGSAKKGTTQSAEAILVYFYWCSKEGKKLDPRVRKYLKAARLRYRKDPKLNIAKALWLVKPERGNPGRVIRKRKKNPRFKRLTLGEEKEAGMIVLDKADDVSEKRAVLDCVEMFGVSERTIRGAAAKVRSGK